MGDPTDRDPTFQVYGYKHGETLPHHWLSCDRRCEHLAAPHITMNILLLLTILCFILKTSNSIPSQQIYAIVSYLVNFRSASQAFFNQASVILIVLSMDGMSVRVKKKGQNRIETAA